MDVTRCQNVSTSHMPRHKSARGAYCWAVETLIRRRGAQGVQDYDPDGASNDGIPKGYAVLDAIDIVRVSEDHDIIDGRHGSWFFMDNFSDPSEPHGWTEGERLRLNAAYKRYGRALERKNLIE